MTEINLFRFDNWAILDSERTTLLYFQLANEAHTVSMAVSEAYSRAQKKKKMC